MDEAATIEELNRVRRETAAEEAMPAPASEAVGTSPLTVRLLAAAKDGLDWALDLLLIGEVPFIGQVPGMLFSLFIAYHLNQGSWFKAKKIRIILFGVALVLDNLPLINNLPLTFLSVIF